MDHGGERGAHNAAYIQLGIGLGAFHGEFGQSLRSAPAADTLRASDHQCAVFGVALADINKAAIKHGDFEGRGGKVHFLTPSGCDGGIIALIASIGQAESCEKRKKVANRDSLLLGGVDLGRGFSPIGGCIMEVFRWRSQKIAH